MQSKVVRKFPDIRPRSMFLLALMASPALMTGCTPEQGERQVTYSEDVSPILDKYCLECHAPLKEGAHKSGFVVDTYESVMEGTKFGAVVIAGSSASSSLYRLVSGKADPSIKMPHGKESLTEDEIETIQVWIDQGARK